MTQALYRRYRPENFAEVIGQEHVTGPLRQALRSGSVNHAYLFSGPRGCGKTSSARILARILNCAQNTPEHPTDTPCGECESCRELARGGPGSLDVVEIDAASHGGVDDARELRERATFAPARDRFKIFILDEAHMVTPQGFNALLKIVEEPPPHVKFVFATTEPDKVIGTIRSRTHHYPFRLVPPDVLTGFLAQVCETEGVTVGAGVLPLVVRAGAGSVRDALSVLDQLVAGSGEGGIDYEGAVALLGYTHVSLLDDLIGAFAVGDGASAFRVVERVISTGHEPRRFVEDLLERLRDLIVIAASGDAAAAVFRELPSDQLKAMRAQAAHLGAAELSRGADLVNDALREMTGATSPRLHLELLVARLLLPAADDGAAGYGARLDRLERGWSTSAAPQRVAPSGAMTPAPDVAPVAADAVAAAGPRTAGAGTTGSTSSKGSGVAAVRAALGTGRTAPRATAPAAPPPAPVEDVAWPEVAQPGEGVPHRTSDPATSGEPPEAAISAGAAEETDAPTSTPTTTVPSASVPAVPMPSAPAPAEPASAPAVLANAPSIPSVPATPAVATAEVAGHETGDTEVLRRRWPEVLETLKQIKRVTWILVSQNAQVAHLDASTLRLAFSAPGLATTFRNGPHGAAVQQAVRETLGFDVTVEGGLATGAGAGAPASTETPGHRPEPGGRPTPPQRTPPTASVAPVAASVPAPAAPAPELATARPTSTPRPERGVVPADDVEPPPPTVPEHATWVADDIPDAEDPGDPEWRSIEPTDLPRGTPAARGTAGARGAADVRGAAAARSSAGPTTATPSGGSTARTAPVAAPASRPAGRPLTAREAGELAYKRAEAARKAVTLEDDSPSPDDPDLATSGLTGAPLVAQMLGGTVIDEQVGDEA